MAGEPVLHQGDHTHTDWIKHLQSMLTYRGHHVEADGIFGHGTHAAVEAFQGENHLTADGVVGAHTWAALNGEPAPGGSSATGGHAGAAGEHAGATGGHAGAAGEHAGTSGHGGAGATGGGGQVHWGHGNWEPQHDAAKDQLEVYASIVGPIKIARDRHQAHLEIRSEHGHVIAVDVPLEPYYDGMGSEDNPLVARVPQVVAQVGHGVLHVKATLPPQFAGEVHEFDIAAAFDAATDLADMPHNHHAAWGDHSSGAAINVGRANSIDLWCVAGGQDPIYGETYTVAVVLTGPDGQTHHQNNWLGDQSETYHPGDAIHVLVGDPRHHHGGGNGVYQISATLPAELGGGHLETHATVE